MSAKKFINSLYQQYYITDPMTHYGAMLDAIDSIKYTHKEYYEWLDDADLDDFDELTHLIIHAPILQIKFWLISKLDLSKNGIDRVKNKGENHVVF